MLKYVKMLYSLEYILYYCIRIKNTNEMRNESEFIKCSKKRFLTAKAQKFVDRCIEIAANQRGLNRYSPEFKEVKDKISSLLKSLFIDKNKSIDEIKEMIRNRTLNDYSYKINLDKPLNELSAIERVFKGHEI